MHLIAMFYWSSIIVVILTGAGILLNFSLHSIVSMETSKKLIPAKHNATKTNHSKLYIQSKPKKRAEDLHSVTATQQHKPIEPTMKTHNDTANKRLKSTVTDWIKNLETKNNNCQQKHIVSIKSIGRLGNQMYEYANLLGFCLTYDCIPVMTKEMEAEISANFPYSHMPTYKHVAHCNLNKIVVSSFSKLTRHSTFQAKNQSNSYFISAFPKATSYFVSYFDIIKSEFRFPTEVQNSVDEAIQDILRTYQTDVIVGFHIRRTDMKGRIKHRGGDPPGKDYFYRAMDYHLQKRPQSVFAIFSDDVSWCKQNMQEHERFRVVFPGSTVLFDLAFLSSCNHSIYTHGTFGFFGSYLTKGDLVYPDNFYPPSDIPSEISLFKEHKHSNWISLPAHV